MVQECLGCSLAFETSRGLANHRRRCRAHKAVAANALRTRLRDLRRNEREDQAVHAAVQRLAEEQIDMEVDVNVDLEQADVSLPIVLPGIIH